MAQAALHTPVHPTISVHRVEGSAVFNPQGERIGRVEDILIDKVSGQAASVIVIYGGPASSGGERHPVPWSSLHYDVVWKGYVVDEQRLRTAPALADARWRSDDLPWRDEVYQHWAAPPYWMGR